MSGLVSPVARRLVDEERRRRSDLLLAVLDIVEGAAPHFGFTLDDLRRHLSLYYGKELAEGATVADLLGAAASAGGCPTAGTIWNVKLRKPSREARLRIAAKWNADLSPPEIPMIRRHRNHDGRSAPLSKGANGYVPTSDPVNTYDMQPGSMYQVSGTWKQVPEPSTIGVCRTGGKKNTARRRRMPGYIACLRAFLDREPATPFAKNEAMISAVDRQILEYIIEGKTIRWIADEMGMKRPTVHKRVKGLRDDAGIAGPGSGR